MDRNAGCASEAFPTTDLDLSRGIRDAGPGDGGFDFRVSSKTTVIRTLTADDVEEVRWALYAALAWSPDRQLPPLERTLQHPEVARYHQRWGRQGDLGVIATMDGDLVGVAYCRLFTADDHGHGYLDDETPEIAVAVRDGYRGRGLGERLLIELAQVARGAGFARLSLSVDSGNRAAHLYRRVGYREISRDEHGIRMVLPLDDE
jgi:GNAT superfamily N-acetyltransferase